MPSKPLSRLVLASGNVGKHRELAALLEGKGIELSRQSDFGVPEAAETCATFVENALLKARNACRHAGLPALADDSGLCVDALQGAPGLHSARYAGPQATDAENRGKLLDALADQPDGQRAARFHCTLVLLRHPEDPAPFICEADWPGRIAGEARGDQGFGYDPIFIPAGFECTAAELDPAEKNRISHRGQALAKLMGVLVGRR